MFQHLLRTILLLFPIIYVFTFFVSLQKLYKHQLEGLLIFVVFALPIYTHSLSVCNLFGFPKLIPVLQSFKEIIIAISVYLVFIQKREKPNFHIIDKLMLAFLAYNTLYILLPVGNMDFFAKFTAFKNLTLFTVLYYLGRYVDFSEININKLYTYMSVLALIATGVLLFEIFTDEFMHTRTGYARYIEYRYGQSPNGNYGLSWTFESSLGKKRFGSIFTDPLEFSCSTVICVCALISLSTNKFFKIQLSKFNLLVLIATGICIVFAISRASFVGFFLLIYSYGWISKNKVLLKAFHMALLAAVAILFFLLVKTDIYELIVDTINFREASTVGHLVQWVEGINAIIGHPFGMGLGKAGYVSMQSNENTGGENQLIIIGVQTGLISMILYTMIYVLIIKEGLKNLPKSKGKKRKIILTVILAKIGLIIPLMTSNADSFNYVMFITYFLSGLMINSIVNSSPKKEKIQDTRTISVA